MEWLKRWWKWVLAGLAITIAFTTGLLFRRRAPGAVDEPRREIERETEAKEQEAETKRDREVAEVQAEHAEDVKALEADVRKKTEELENKPGQETTDYLLDIGKRIREE